MPKGKRTPGPWVFVEDAEGLGIPMVYSSATQAMVAITDSDLLFADAPADEQEANARLIAAAPELLEALIDVTASLAWNAHGECRAVHEGPIMPSAMAIETARAVIAKAKGEA